MENNIQIHRLAVQNNISKSFETDIEKGKWQVGMTKPYQGKTYVVSGFNTKGNPLWRVMHEGSKPTDDNGGSTDKVEEKQEQQTTQQSSNSKFTMDELKDDLNTMNDWQLSNQEKKRIAEKYGVNSNKAAEIKDEIMRLMNEDHKSRTTYTIDDVRTFDRYWDVPRSSQKLKQAFADESEEFVNFYIANLEDKLKQSKGMHLWSAHEKSMYNCIKTLKTILNGRKNSSDVGRKQLIENLNKETKAFHDEYIEQVKKYHANRFEQLEKMRDFKIEDYMSYFGTVTESRYEYMKNNVRSLDWKVREFFYKYNSDYSREYEGADKSITVFGVKHDAKKIRVRAYGSTAGSENIHPDLPSHTALDMKKDVDEVVVGNTKEKYVGKEVEHADKKYSADIETVADRVRKMGMNESNLTVKSVSRTVNGVGGFDIYISDGDKTVHARSIFAAENSVLVSPHYRFIIT